MERPGLQRVRARLGAAFIGAVSGLITGSAVASPVQVACAGTTTVTYSPGLTYETQTVAVSGSDLADCVSLTHPALTSLADTFESSSSLSCADLAAGGQSGTEVLVWNDKSSLTSEWDFTTDVQAIEGNVVTTFTGPIVSGLLKGAMVTLVVTLAESELDACNTDAGLEQTNAHSVWTFKR